MSEHQDRIFFRNFALILVVLTLFGIAASIVGRQIAKQVPSDAQREVIAKRVAPVAKVYTENNPPPAAAAAPAAASATATASGADKGKQVYDTVCMACHTSGVAGAPVLGDEAAWGPRIERGVDTLYERAINGFQGDTGIMPPKGGRADLSDEDVKAAVDYIAANSGGSAAPAPAAVDQGEGAEQAAQDTARVAATEAEATATAPAPAAAADPGEGIDQGTQDAAPAAATEAESGSTAPATAVAADQGAGVDQTTPDAGPIAATEAEAGTTDKGKQVHDTVCMVCHGTGTVGAPKTGDQAAWAQRIAQGTDVLYEHAIKGFVGPSGMMPPKGGRTDLPDEDVKAAVDYMVNAAK